MFEIILIALGLLVGTVGFLLLREPWQKRVAALLGALLIIGALMSVLMEVTTALVWGIRDPEEIPPYEPGTLIAELAGMENGTWTPVPSLTPRLTPLIPPEVATPTPSPVVPTATDTPPATDTPRPTDTPGPPTLTPTATDTARPIPIDATPVTVVPPGATPVTVEPTETLEPTAEKPADKPTPEPEPIRLSLTKLDSDLRGVAITNPESGSQDVIFELGGRSRFNPVYSAAWSPDGKRVVISYGWLTSEYDQGIRLQVVNADGTNPKDILSLTTAGEYRGLGNALWSPSGDKIIFAFYDGPDNGVWEINPDGSGLRRLNNSVPGEWPRYWTVDGAWIITVTGEGGLFALEVDGSRRLPLSSLGPLGVYDERYYPWRSRLEARCEQQEDSWWKCK